MICKNCGGQCEARFCIYCGAPMEAPQPTYEQPFVGAAESMESSPAQQPPVAPVAPGASVTTGASEGWEMPAAYGPAAPQESAPPAVPLTPLAPVTPESESVEVVDKKQAKKEKKERELKEKQEKRAKEKEERAEKPQKEKMGEQKPQGDKTANGKEPPKTATSVHLAIQMKAVFWPALAMLLPLFYFIVDIFAVVPAQLMQGSGLVELFDMLTSSAFATNSISELATYLTGEEVVLLQLISVKTLGAAGQLLLPLLLTLALAALSAAVGVWVLFTGGRALRSRLVCNLVAVGGIGSLLAPALGKLLLRITLLAQNGFIGPAALAATDTAMAAVSLTVEAVLVMGVLLSLQLPAVCKLMRTGAGARGDCAVLVLPFSAIKSYVLCRRIATAAALLVLAVSGSYFLLDILNVGGLADWSGAWQAAIDELKVLAESVSSTITGGGAALTVMAVGAPVLKLCFFVLTPLVVFFMLGCLFSLLRVARTDYNVLLVNRSARFGLREVMQRARRAVAVPFYVLLMMQGLLTVLVIAATPLLQRVSFGDIEGTLQVIYLTVSRVRFMGTYTTLFALLLLLGIVLAVVAGSCSRRMLSITDESVGTNPGKVL